MAANSENGDKKKFSFSMSKKEPKREEKQEMKQRKPITQQDADMWRGGRDDDDDDDGRPKAPIVIPVFKGYRKDAVVPPPLESADKKEIKSEQTAPTGPMSAEEEAAQALISDAKRRMEESDMKKRYESEGGFVVPDAPIPMLVEGAIPGMEQFGSEDDKFKHDIEFRAENPDIAAYRRVPVESYGTGMLMGMGWKPGQAIGKTNKVAMEPITYVGRGHRQGLGADAGAKPTNKKEKKFIKPGESREPKEQMRVAPDADGRVRHFRMLSERIIPVHSMVLKVGALVEIIDGPHKHLFGRVTSVEEENPTNAQTRRVGVKLNLSNEVVNVTRADLDLLDEHALPKDHPAFDTEMTASNSNQNDPFGDSAALRALLNKKDKSTKQKASASRSRSRSRSRSDSRSKSRSSSSSSSRSPSPAKTQSPSKRKRVQDQDAERGKKQKKKEKKKEKKEKKDKKKKKKSKKDEDKKSNKNRDSDEDEEERETKQDDTPITWVVANIRVRITSKSLRDGRLYNKKARVEDVVSRSRFVIVTDDGNKLVEDVRESWVQTALPKPGGLVMVVAGEDKGNVGVLLERNPAKDQAVVQLKSDLSIIYLSFDQVAEYVPA